MDTVHECDRQTDRRTDRITITKTVQRRASHGNKILSNPVIIPHVTYLYTDEATETQVSSNNLTAKVMTVKVPSRQVLTGGLHVHSGSQCVSPVQYQAMDSVSVWGFS